MLLPSPPPKGGKNLETTVTGGGEGLGVRGFVSLLLPLCLSPIHFFACTRDTLIMGMSGTRTPATLRRTDCQEKWSLSIRFMMLVDKVSAPSLMTPFDSMT